MKPINLLFLLLLFPALSFCQTITSPAVGSSDDPSTTIVKIETTKNYTAVVFKHISLTKGNWLELSKAIYIQDADNDDRYNYLRSQGITIKPQRQFSKTDNEETDFTVYFEKLKPGVKKISIIEKAVSEIDKMQGSNFFNYYNVSLSKSDTIMGQTSTGLHVHVITDTARMSPFSNGNFNMGAMMNSMFTSVHQAQLQFYSDRANIDKIAKIDKDYYDALMRSGFSARSSHKDIGIKAIGDNGSRGKIIVLESISVYCSQFKGFCVW